MSASFFEQQRQLALQVQAEREQKKRELEESKHEHLQTLFDRTASLILNGWEEKVKQAVLKHGKTSVSIFSYNTSDKLDDRHPFIFLIKGPRNKPNCWEDGKWRSVMQQVRAAIPAAHVDHNVGYGCDCDIVVDWTVPVEPL